MRFLLPTLLTLNLTTLAETPEQKNNQLTQIKKEIRAHLSNGLAQEHPKILNLLDDAKALGTDLTLAQLYEPDPQETILLITGLETFSVKTGKTTNLKNLLNQGWKIKNIIPAGENKAYAWLQKN